MVLNREFRGEVRDCFCFLPSMYSATWSCWFSFVSTRCFWIVAYSPWARVFKGNNSYGFIQVLTLWMVVSPVEVVPDVISQETYFNLLCFCRLMYYINSVRTNNIQHLKTSLTWYKLGTYLYIRPHPMSYALFVLCSLIYRAVGYTALEDLINN